MLRTKGLKIIFSLLFSFRENGFSFNLRLIATFLLILAGVIVSISLPWGLKFIIDSLSIEKAISLKLITTILIGYGTLWMITQIILNLRQLVAHSILENNIKQFSSRIFNKLLALPISYYVQQATGNIISAFEQIQFAVHGILMGLLFVIIPTVIEITLAASLLTYYYGIKYSCLLVSVFLVYMLFTLLTTSWIIKAQLNGSKSHRRTSSYLTDVVLNIEAIYHQSGREIVSQEYKNRLAKRELAVVKHLTRASLVGVGQSLIAGLGFILMTVLAGLDVAQNKLAISDFVLLNGYLLQFLTPLNMIGMILRNIRDGATKLEDAINLLQYNDKKNYTTATIILKQQPSEVVFDNVSFTYPNKALPVLRKLNFVIPQSHSVAITGPNGSGKSTITKLLYRLYEPSNGSILIQQENIKNVRLSSLANLMAIVPQDIFLLNDTIDVNIKFGINTPLPPYLFAKIMEITQLNNWLKVLPDGKNTLVGERGVKLSGGEKRRIGIARALLRKPQILVLDEAMSSLDRATERQIIEHLREDYKNITQIVITHDEQNLSQFDDVIQIDKCMPIQKKENLT